MTEVNSYPPGTFCRAELAASDSNKAKEFYGKIPGWEFTDVPIGEGMVYSTTYIGGKKAVSVRAGEATYLSQMSRRLRKRRRTSGAGFSVITPVQM